MQPQIPPHIEAQDKDSRALEEPYVPSTQEPQHEDIQPTYLEEEHDTPIIEEGTSDPIQGLDKLVEDDDVTPPIEVRTEHGVEREDVEPSFQEVPRSLDLPATHAVETTQANVGMETLQGGEDVVEEEESKIEAPITEPQIPPQIEAQDKESPTLEEPYVPSTQEPQHEDIQPTYLQEQQGTPIIKERTSHPIQGLDKLVEDDDVNGPTEVPTQHGVEHEDVEPSFEDLPRSLDLPATHAVETNQRDVGVEALQGGEDVVEEEESKIEDAITEPQIPSQTKARDEKVSVLEEPYVPSIEQREHEDVQPTYLKEHQDTPIIEEGSSDAIQGLDKLVENDDVNAPIEVPTEHGVEHKDVEPSIEEVPRSLDLPATHAVETTQGDVGVEALQAGQDVVEEEESKIEAAITEPKIPPQIEAQDKKSPTLEEPYVPSTQEPQHEDVQPTYFEEEQDTPIIDERTSDPIQELDKLVEDDVVNVPIEVPTEHGVEREDVEPNIEEVPRSLDLPATHAVETTQGDVGVEALQGGEDVVEEEESKIEAPITEPQIPPHIEARDEEVSRLVEPYVPSTQEPQHEDIQPTYLEEEHDTPIIEEGTSDPIQGLDKLVEDDDVTPPIEVRTEHGVEREDVEPTFQEVPRSLDLPATHAVETTQADVGREAWQGGEDVAEEEESKIEAPITEPQIPPQIEAQDKESPALEEPYVPSTQEPQHEDIQPTNLEEQQDTPIIEERTKYDEELEVEDVAPVFIEEEEETPIVKEEKNTPIQTIDELPQHGDVEEPFEVPTKKEVEPKEVELGFEEVARSLELPLNRPIEETQEHVGVESPINPPIEETREDVEVEGFQLVEDAFPLENVPSTLIQQATSVEGDNWRTWKRELEANAMDKLFAQENLTPKETKNGDILEGPWPGVGSALEESIVSTKDPCGNDEKEIIGAEEAETMENKVELDMQPPSKPVLEKDIIEDAKAKETMVVDNVEARESTETNATFEEQHHKHTFVPMEIPTSKTKEVFSTLEEPQVHIVEEEKELVVKPNLEKEPQSNALDEALIQGHTNGEVALEWPTHDSLVKKVEAEPTLEEGTSQLIAIDETLISKVDEGIFQESQLVVPSVEEEKDIEGKHSMEKLGFIRLDEVLGEKIPIEESKEVEDIPKLVEPQVHITREEKEVELILEKSKELELEDSQRNTNESPSTSNATSKDQGTNLDESNKVQGEFDTPQVVDQTWEQLKSNWKNFKGRPDIHVTNKVRQAAREAKEKARKVVGLPWPPARLSTSTQNVEDERKVSAPIVETNANPSEVVDEFVGTRRELTCEPNTLESKVNELVDHTNNFPTKIETIPTGELILYV
ncbi:unnamed protein product [Sphagnum jensenii]|uniref:Titin-like n=1 Tax=Sphagnum jensenii TaxID=128206 RepID=A0ABP1AZI2_9BRYO